MTIAGDPFETPELDERRRRQRRHLRTVDPVILERVVIDDLPVIPAGTDVRWLEVELRRLADQEIVHLDELLRRSEERRGKNMVAEFVRRNLHDDPDSALGTLVDDLVAEAARGQLEGVRPRDRVAIRRYLQLTSWADALVPAAS